MLETTNTLKRDLEGIPSYRERARFVRDAYKGETAYVISCGPTLSEVDFEKMKKHLKNKLVVCVKQSFDFFKDICDVHIYNCANFKTYDYTGSNAIVVESTSFGKILNRKTHLKFHILERRFEESVSMRTEEIDKYRIDNVFERPYGPGIMYETVFYVLQQLGVSEIVTIGWDNSLNSKREDGPVHFYDSLKGDRRQFVQDNDQRTSVAWSSLTTEEKITVSAMGEWHDWLDKQGIVLKVISRTNPAPERVERLSKEFVYGGR
jgi:hypothetical protein